MLEIDWVTILWEIVNFVIITVVLYFLVFKPIVKRSEARAAKKALLLKELEENKEASDIHLHEIEKRLQNLDKEIRVILDETYEQSKVYQSELLASTHDEANQILQNAILEVRKEQLFDLKAHQEKLVDVIIMIASKTLKEVTPKAVHDSLIEELLNNIWNLGKTDIRRVQTIRDSLSERIPTAKVSVAIPITLEQERNLVQTFNALADRDVNIEVEEVPELISGLKVRMGDLIIENSLASQLEDYVDEIKGSLYQLNKTHD